MARKLETVAIIGGGLAGLTAAARLAQQGVRVAVYEARPTLGGSCATTTLAGYTFNDGALYLAMPALLDHVFAQLGLDRDRLLPLVRITAPQTSLLPNGARVVFGNGTDVRVAQPDGRTCYVDLAPLIERWQPVLRIFRDELAVRPFSLVSFLRHAWRVLPRLRGTVADEMNRLYADDVVRAALAGLVLYTGLPASRTPAFQMLGLVTLFVDGFFVPPQGMGQITRCLANAATANGATLHTGRRVTRVDVRAGRAAALAFADGEVVAADSILSTVSGMHTARLLAAAAPAAMRKRAARAPLSLRALAVQLGLRGRIGIASHGFTVLPWMHEQAAYFQPDGNVPRYLHASVPTVTLPHLAPSDGSVVEMFPPIRQDVAVEAWDDAAVERAADGAVAALARHFPLDIAVRRVIGPRQYRDDMGLFDGAIYGLSPAAGVHALFPAVSGVPCLFQAGQTTYPGYGVVSAALSGLFAADELRR